ncbi:NAD(P)/FAD-dependent oxidoreductase [Catellatospora chokoriensis]|uniref:D-amino-acid oxidase n=1 Tax=Catellatospora chokoriensis TaxID=310353 RepID=A0A8J3KD85_9ACTN|nr:FAD-dependent oxidoreductase [Catellatospora chokoriensis]GIF94623.1 D-amino-acid oxidase [Catellatospora chokoriensis]
MFTANADVTVVGSGLLGLSTAFELLRRDLTVTIVGPHADGARGQASTAAGAMLTVFSEVEADHLLDRVETEVAHRIAARQLYATWLADIAEASGVHIELTPGVWVIANGYGEDDAAQLAAIESTAKRHGWQAEYGTPTEVPGLSPQIRAFQAVWLPGEASLDPARLMAALEASVVGHPRCRWIEGTATKIEELGEHMLVTTDGATTALSAHLVLAAGAMSSRLLNEPLADQAAVPPVLSGRGVSMLVHAPFRLPAAVRTPNRGFACGSHMVPRPDGTVYLGATNRLSTEPDYNRDPDLDEVATLIHDAAAELHTALRQATLITTRVGHRPVTLDHLPLLGTTGHPMIHMASATYRCGVLLAPLAANIVADCVTAPQSHAGHPYRPTRQIATPALNDLLQDSARGLVDMLCQPGGVLPAGTDQTLAHVLHAALSEIATGNSTRAAAMRRIWQRAPMAEAVPLLLDAVGRLR